MQSYRRRVPKFAPSRYSDHELPGVVADICRDLDPVDPLAVSQPRFDAGRAAAGHPEAPTAKRICARLALSWEAVKQLALDPTRSVDRTVGIRTGKQDETWLGDDVCLTALRVAAARLADEETLSPGRYEEIAEQMLAENRRRYRHGGRLVMPTVGQIEWRLGPWPEALAKAGLKRRGHTGRPGLPIADAIELFLEATGCLVGRTLLTRLCKINDLSLGQRWEKPSYPVEVARVRERRAAVGKWTPPKYTRTRQRPDLLIPIPDLDGPTRHIARQDEETCIEFMMLFLTERRGRSQTRTDYVKWASKTPGAPSASTLGRGGRPGFAAIREEARLRLREQELRRR
jgi:hypothetical protein